MASESGSTESTKSKAIKVAVLVVVVGAAVFMWLRSGGDGQLDTAESAALYLCPKDSATLDVTPAAYERMLKSGDVGPAEEASGGMARRPGSYVRCPTCNKRTMVGASRCPQDGSVFRTFSEDQKPGSCPKCGWKPPTER